MVLHSWVHGWVGFWENVKDADHGGICGITHRRAEGGGTK